MQAPPFAKLNADTLRNCFKLGIAVVIAMALAMVMCNSDPGWAVTTVVIVQALFLGTTLEKGILRLWGNILGLAVGLVLMPAFTGTKSVAVIVFSIWISVCCYFIQRSRYPLAWKWAFTASSEVFLFNILYPEAAVSFSLNRLGAVFLGIVVSVAVNTLLWPNRSGDAFLNKAQDLLRLCTRLFSVKVSILTDPDQPIGPVRALEKQVIDTFPKVRQTLSEAIRDSNHFQFYQERYHGLVLTMQELAKYAIGLELFMRSTGHNPFLHEAAGVSTLMKEATTSLERQFVLLQERFAGAPEQGSFEAQARQTRQCLERVSDLKVTPEFEDRDALDGAVFLATVEQLEGVEEQLTALRQRLQALDETPDMGEQFMPLAPVEAGEAFRFNSIYMHKTVVAFVVTILVLCLWMATGFPEGKFGVFWVLLISRFNALLPYIPTRGALAGIFGGGAIAYFMHMGVVPLLDHYWQYCLVLFPVFFGMGFCIYSPDANVRVFGSFGSIVISSVIGITVPDQVYDTEVLLQKLLAMGGGAVLCVMIMNVLWPIVPEKLFRREVAGFLSACRQFARDALELTSDMKENKPLLDAFQQKRRTMLRVCDLWASMVRVRDPGDRENLQGVLNAIRIVAIQLHHTQERRRPLPDYPRRDVIRPQCNALREYHIEVLASFERTVAMGERTPEKPDMSRFMHPLREELDSLRKMGKTDATIRNLVFELMLRVGLFMALNEGLISCHRRLNTVDWNGLERTFLRPGRIETRAFSPAAPKQMTSPPEP